MSKNIDLGSFSVDVQLQKNGKFDVYIAHEGSSGEHYKDVTADRIGELVAGDIECIAEGYQNEFGSDPDDFSIRAKDIRWDIDIDTVYEIFDEMTAEEASEILGLPLRQYSNMTTSERDDWIYSVYNYSDVDKIELLDLPDEVLLPDGLSSLDDVSDYLSDTYEFCHDGFTLDYDFSIQSLKDEIQNETNPQRLQNLSNLLSLVEECEAERESLTLE